MHTKNINQERSDSKMNKKLEQLLEGVSEQDLKLLKEMDKLNLSGIERSKLLKQLRHSDRNIKVYDHRFSGKHVKIGVISDLHIGNKFFDQDLYMKAVRVFDKEKVDTIYCPGDLIEGMSNREGHIYELEYVGITEQVNRAAELIDLMPKKVYGITGNHELWAKNKANQGMDVGDYLDNKCDNYTNLGEMEADIDIGSGIILKLYHGQDGSAYAPGYRGMKLIESLQGGQKPNILLAGHTHKYVQMFQRNIHYLECGCLEGQTGFMRGKKLMAHKGFSIIDIYFNKEGVDRFKVEFYPKYT